MLHLENELFHSMAKTDHNVQYSETVQTNEVGYQAHTFWLKEQRKRLRLTG